MGEPVRYRVPDDVRSIMERHDEVNWSAVARNAVRAYIKAHLPEEYRTLAAGK